MSSANTYYTYLIDLGILPRLLLGSSPTQPFFRTASERAGHARGLLRDRDQGSGLRGLSA